MIKKFLLDILKSPKSQSKLTLNSTGSCLTGGDELYVIQNDVPVLVPENLIQDAGNIKFNYRDHYENDARSFDYFEPQETSVTKKERERSRQAIIQAIPKATGLLLDVGCGGAWLAQYCIRKKIKCVSMDISPTNPIGALRRFPDENHAAVIGDVFYLPFDNNVFDTIVASEVLEHVVDPALFIQKLLEKIKPGGKLVLVTPYNENITYNLCIHCNGLTPANAHLHSFNKKNIKKYLPQKGINYKTSDFQNKYLTRLRIYSMLHFLPFSIWKFTDRVFNLAFRKNLTFLIEIVKKR
jgi:2-polyprenyl-3-methyl-5-hydroxy-6-metoxy-1,4-benzoquinol methylase